MHEFITSNENTIAIAGLVVLLVAVVIQISAQATSEDHPLRHDLQSWASMLTLVSFIAFSLACCGCLCNKGK